MALATLGLFIAGLIICLSLGLPLIAALSFGYLLFFLYGLRYGFSAKKIATLTAGGIWSVHKVLMVFFLIGMLTASWRASGTIPYIVAAAGGFMKPEIFPLAAFLLNSGLSLLIGTSFGTVATMGAICMSIGNMMGINPMITGGAILGGLYVGDRCSPLSTSALVVAAITKTEFYDNLRRMFRSALLPFGISCLIYMGLGIWAGAEGVPADTAALFEKSYVLTPLLLLPAAVVIIMPLLKIDVKITMSTSLILALLLCVFVQHMDISTIPGLLLSGYRAGDPALSRMMNGGGMVSMIMPAFTVGISCSYSEILQQTDLLKKVKSLISGFLMKGGKRFTFIVVAAASAMVTCNQTLSSILTQQLCDEIVTDREDMMIAIENTTIVMASLIPWSIACSVPLSTLEAPTASILFACYLYLQPLLGWKLK